MNTFEISMLLLKSLPAPLLASAFTYLAVWRRRLLRPSAKDELTHLQTIYEKQMELAPDLPSNRMLKARLDKLAEAQAFDHITKQSVSTRLTGALLTLTYSLAVAVLELLAAHKAIKEWPEFVVLVVYSCLAVYLVVETILLDKTSRALDREHEIYRIRAKTGAWPEPDSVKLRPAPGLVLVRRVWKIASSPAVLAYRLLRKAGKGHGQGPHDVGSPSQGPTPAAAS